jgi:hypothetical protein
VCEAGAGRGPLSDTVMAGKFKMSNGKEGMLRGQAPDAFQAADPSMPKRSYATDTEFERMAVKPQKTYADSTGYTSQMAGLATDGVMEQAITDKLNQSMQTGIEDGYKARIEEEAQDRAKNLTDAEIDAKEDSKNVDDDDLEALRARRRQQMKDAQDKRQKYRTLGHGEYSEIEEEAFLKTVTSSERAVVHFYHSMFEKCKVMDMHLNKISRKFLGTRVVKLNAEKAPFFVEKLMIKTLPCAVVFVDGVAVGRQMGFDGLGGEEFQTVQLAWIIKELGGLEEDFGPEDDIEWV